MHDHVEERKEKFQTSHLFQKVRLAKDFYFAHIKKKKK